MSSYAAAPSGEELGGGPPGRSELQTFAAFLVRRALIIVMCAALGVLFGLLYALLSPNVYQASELLSARAPASQNASPSDQAVASAALAQTQTRVINDSGFLSSAAQALKAPDLPSHVSASAVPNTTLIEINATGSSPDAARSLVTQMTDYTVRTISAANDAQQAATVDQLQSQVAALETQIASLISKQAATPPGAQSQILRDSISSLQAQRSALQQQIANEYGSGATQRDSIRRVSLAHASSAPISPRPAFDVVLGLFFGILLGLVLAWVRDQLDRRVHSIEEVERITRRPILVAAPIVRNPREHADGVLANAFDGLRVNLSLSTAKLRGRVFTITSTREREGKTFTTLGLGEALARAGRRAILVDGDIRRRTLTATVLAQQATSPAGDQSDGASRGLSDVLQGIAAVPDVVIRLGNGLVLLPAGSHAESPPTLLDSQQFEGVVNELRSSYDYVLIDTPPLTRVPDARLTSVRSDGVILVVRLGLTLRTELSSVADTLGAEPFTLVGSVVYSPDLAAEGYYAYEASPPGRRRWPGVPRTLARGLRGPAA